MGLIHSNSEDTLSIDKGPEDGLDWSFIEQVKHQSVVHAGFGYSKDPEIIAEARAYIKRFLITAKAEQAKYGIPASISLAQGILESKRGGSVLATEGNNHFGIKCFKKHNHRKAGCLKLKDEKHLGKQWFCRYERAWDCWRARSILITNGRYADIRGKCGPKDPKGWAIALKQAGYATDRNYVSGLMSVVNGLNLTQYD